MAQCQFCRVARWEIGNLLNVWFRDKRILQQKRFETQFISDTFLVGKIIGDVSAGVRLGTLVIVAKAAGRLY